jgi:predicted CopG family antitoxin
MWLCSYLVMGLTEYATISVPVNVKKRLEKAKGKKEWGEFLLELYTEAQQLKSKKAFQELTETLTEEDLQAITESSREFREQFAFR